MERRTLPQWNVEYHHTHFQPVAMRTSFEIVEPGQSHSLRPDCCLGCAEAWRDWKISWQVIRESAQLDSKWIELHYKNVSFSMESTLEHRRIPRHHFQRISSSESTLHSLFFSLCFTAVTRQQKKNAPTNFKTCWSRCYTNQLHWFLHKLRKKCAPVFTQALQKLVFTPTIPCTQNSFCTI